jgi:lipoyl(octanoyl) transferase
MPKPLPRLVKFEDLGIVRYKDAWDYQEKRFAEIIDTKIRLRKAPNENELPANLLLFCEHPPVYTLGKSGKIENLLLNEAQLGEREIDFYKINRGGDITFHGPGQIVGYPIIDLDQFFTDIHKYLRLLEEAVIMTLAEYGIDSGRIDGLTGVWLDTQDMSKARKICALGVKCSRWVTMHGFAFNVNTDLEYFNHIIPCGIDDKAVTSMERELGRSVDMKEVSEKLKIHLTTLFDWSLV